MCIRDSPYLGALAGNRRGGKGTATDLLCMVRAGKGRDSLGMADLTGDDVAHEQSAAQLDTLSETEHGKRIGYEAVSYTHLRRDTQGVPGPPPHGGGGRCRSAQRQRARP